MNNSNPITKNKRSRSQGEGDHLRLLLNLMLMSSLTPDLKEDPIAPQEVQALRTSYSTSSVTSQSHFLATTELA
jgi:hypothetical protein